MPERSSRCHRNPEFNSCRKQFINVFGKPIEEYDSIKRAVEVVGEVSKQNYYRNLPNYFMFLAEDPDAVIRNRRKHISSGEPELEEYYERKTTAFVNSLKDKGLAGRGITGIVGRIQGFYTNNSKRYSLNLGNLRIPKARKTAKFSPDNMQVRELLSFADVRGTLIVSLMYQCGPAPVDVSELRRGDLPRDPWVYFEKSRSKTGEVWRGVSTPDVCAALNAYLKQTEGGPNDLLFRSREGYLDNEGVSRVVNDLINRAGYGDIAGFVPKCLRDGLEDALVDANVNFKVKETLMAHSANLNISAEYGSEAKMQKRLVEAVKATYPLICLNEANRVVGNGVDMDKLSAFMEMVPDLQEIAKLKREGKLFTLDDPLLEDKLRAAGVRLAKD